MPRAISVVDCRDADAVTVRDTLLLGHDQRRSPVGSAAGLRGTVVEFALPSGTRLHHDDRLMLDDGGAIEILARPESLLEIRAEETAILARAAWLFGDHHIPVEIHGRYLRVLRTASAENILRISGLTGRRIESPFEPEGGAYGQVGRTGA